MSYFLRLLHDCQRPLPQSSTTWELETANINDADAILSPLSQPTHKKYQLIEEKSINQTVLLKESTQQIFKEKISSTNTVKPDTNLDNTEKKSEYFLQIRPIETNEQEKTLTQDHSRTKPASPTTHRNMQERVLNKKVFTQKQNLTKKYFDKKQTDFLVRKIEKDLSLNLEKNHEIQQHKLTKPTVESVDIIQTLEAPTENTRHTIKKIDNKTTLERSPLSKKPQTHVQTIQHRHNQLHIKNVLLRVEDSCTKTTKTHDTKDNTLRTSMLSDSAQSLRGI